MFGSVVGGTEVTRTVEAVWRIESPRLIAGLARMMHDVGVAEELAQDALVAALEQWPAEGVPRNPGAWLMSVAKRRAVDLIRRNERYERKLAEIGHTLPTTVEPDFDAVLADEIEDDLLRLVFVSCHPVLTTEARVALTLRLLGGLTTGEIARAFLVSEPTVAQRVVRAKRALADAGVPFEVPPPQDRPARLASVLEVIYLIFNEGYSATAGDDWVRPALCEDALRLGRVLAGLMPTEAEVHGLVALMEIQASRLRARVGPDGEPVLLMAQDRSRWDHLLIRRGLAALARADALNASPPAPPSHSAPSGGWSARVAPAPVSPSQAASSGGWSARVAPVSASPSHASPSREASVGVTPPSVAASGAPSRLTRSSAAASGAPSPLTPPPAEGSRAAPGRIASPAGASLDEAAARDASSGVASPGPYALQAAIAACHARATDPSETDWVRIADLYDALARSAESPVVELNRAVAVGMAYGPEAGLALVDALVAEGLLPTYHLLPAVRGDLLRKLGRDDEARAEFARAASLTKNERERALLSARATPGS